jgi:ATP-dependent RNA helicase RhlE
MKYSELNLDSRLQNAIDQLGYLDATPIQEQAIPYIITGRDISGLAQTGTGKTAAFLIPLIERILKSETDPEHERAFKDWKPFQTILIMVPTRELADQIHENVEKLTQGTGLKSHAFYGGTGYEKQKEALKNGLHFIVSTPGRLIDLFKEHHVDFKKVRAVVFDEADRMFDMGFKDDMKFVLSRIERTRQFLVFSATLNFDVLNTAYQFGAEPVEINISRDQTKADNVKDSLFHIGNDEKPQHLLSIMKRENPRQTIVFTNYKSNVDRIANFLTINGIHAMGISSLISQAQRNQVIGDFKADNNKNVLVATDVAARGLDITDVDLVINFEMPQDAESYVHRIGRTGRAGAEGKAFSFVSEKDVDSLSRVEEYTKKKIEIGFLEDTDLIKDFKPMRSEEFGFKKGFERDAIRGAGPKSHDSRGPKPRSSGGPDRGAGAKPQRSAAGSNSDRRNDRPLKSGPDRRPSNGAASANAKSDSKPKSNNTFQLNPTAGSAPTTKSHVQQNKNFKPKNDKAAANKTSSASKPVQSAPKSFRKNSQANASLGVRVKSFLKRVFG